MKFRRKPEEVDAIQLTKSNREAVIQFVGKANVKTKPWDPVNLYIIRDNTHDDLVMPGQYVVKEEYGLFKVIDPNIFEAMYETKKEGLKP